MRVAYVTSSLPHGPGEAFLIPELTRLIDDGHVVAVVPVRPRGGIIHGDCGGIASRASRHRLLAPTVLAAALAEAARSPRRVARGAAVVARSRSVVVLAKNVLVLPKALWLARWARRHAVDHIHSAWLSTPATVAMIAAEVAGISWSSSAHRWDIEEDNLLEPKARRAAFVRAISRRGAAAISAAAGPGARVRVIRMGVPVPPRRRAERRSRRLVIAGNLIALKGHRYLFEALSLLRRRGVDVSLDVVGSGPLALELQACARALHVGDVVTFHGAFDHELLLERLEAGCWAAVVVASVVEPDGATEGVPVIMLEAMARSVPVVATNVGAISEIAGDGAALVVPQRDAGALADALATVLADPGTIDRLTATAHARVREECDVEHVVEALVAELAAPTTPAAGPAAVPVSEAAA